MLVGLTRAANLGAHLLLRLFALGYNHRPSLARRLRGVDGPLDFSVGLRTESGAIAQSIRVVGGRVRVVAGVPADVDATMILRDAGAIREMLTRPPDELLLMLLAGRVRVEGNLGVLSLFSHTLAALRGHASRRRPGAATAAGPCARPHGERLTTAPGDAVAHLDEPFLARYSLDDFPTT